MFVRVALTGGIGAGKSTVASHLSERGAYVIDYDEVAREVSSKGSVGLRKIVDLFGPEALAPSGEMDRKWVARAIFNDPQLRAKMDEIVHPLVFAEAGKRETDWLATHLNAGFMGTQHQVVAHDIPLLVESGRADWFDVIIDVEAPAHVRLHRLVDSRGMSMAAAAQRIDSQSSEEQRRALATYVIDSNQPMEQMFEQVDTVFSQIFER